MNLPKGQAGWNGMDPAAGWRSSVAKARIAVQDRERSPAQVEFLWFQVECGDKLNRQPNKACGGG
jgi:hypothetical protein